MRNEQEFPAQRQRHFAPGGFVVQQNEEAPTFIPPTKVMAALVAKAVGEAPSLGEVDPEERTTYLNAIFSVDFASKIIASLTFEDAIATLRAATKNRNILPSTEDEPLFVYEAVPTGRVVKPYRFRALVSTIFDLVDKWEEEQQEYFEKLRSRYEVRADSALRLLLFMKAVEGGTKIEPEGFALQEYQWFDYDTMETVPKKAILNLVEKNGKTLLVGSSYQTKEAREIELQASRTRFWGPIIAYLASWAVISFLFLRREGLVIAGCIGAGGAALLYFQHSVIRSPKGELELAGVLRSTSIAIAAASLGISIFMRSSSKKSIVVLVLLGFFLAVFPLVLSGVNVGRGSLARMNSVIIVMLALSVSCIVAVLLMVIVATKGSALEIDI